MANYVEVKDFATNPQKMHTVERTISSIVGHVPDSHIMGRGDLVTSNSFSIAASVITTNVTTITNPAKASKDFNYVLQVDNPSGVVLNIICEDREVTGGAVDKFGIVWVGSVQPGKCDRLPVGPWLSGLSGRLTIATAVANGGTAYTCNWWIRAL